MEDRNIKDLQLLDWYHPSGNRHVAESLLMQNAQEGHYLLRPNVYGNVFTLSVRAKDSVKHFQLTVSNDGISFGFGKFKDVENLVKHFNNHPLIAGGSGIPLMLKSPYPNEVIEMSHYEQVRLHAEMRLQPDEVDKSAEICHSFQLSNASKEGFLTKQGGRIKTWKHRWCVLQKLEFRYFKHRTDLEPLRTIDLRGCLSCFVDDSQGQSNCFSLELPWRTFYFYSASEQETKDWVEVIKWKLDALKKGDKT